MRALGRTACVVVLCAFAGCKKSNPDPAATSASAPPSAAPAPATPRCSAGSATFTIGERTSAASDPDAGDDEPPQPFAVEVGGAVATKSGFAVAALRSDKGGTTAVVALLDADAGSGRIVELGRVFGDAEPPRLAAEGELLVAAVPDNDAAGGTLKLAKVAGTNVTWGAEVQEGRDESSAFDLELGKRRGVLVWDTFDKSADHGVVHMVSFDPNELGSATRPRTLSPEGDDAEAPALITRPGGFWLSWISRAVVQPKKQPPKTGAKKTDEKTPDAAPPADDPVVDLGRRWLRIAPLDENGALAGEPRDVTPRDTHVLVFDLAPLPGGGALLAWRDDHSAPGVEGGAVHVARVAPGGSIDRFAIEDDKVGAGVPSLLVDAAPPAAGSGLWLALGSVTDLTRLVALAPDARPKDAIGDEPSIGRAEPIAISGGRVLVSRPRGLAIELSVAKCRPGAKPVDAGADGG